MDATFDHICAIAQDDVVVITVNAPVLNDFDIAHATADEVDAAIRRFKLDQIIVDLKTIEFVTSVGLVLFARLLKRVRESKLRAILCNMSEGVEDVLRVSKLFSQDHAAPERITAAVDVASALVALDTRQE